MGRRLSRVAALSMVLACVFNGSSLGADPEERDWDQGFFFIHVSDAHVWDRPEAAVAFLELDHPWWIPRAVFGWFALRRVASRLPVAASTIADSLRQALVPHYDGDVQQLWDSELLPVYIDELLRPGSPLGNGESRVRKAFAEVAALEPAFMVNTGDIVLDSGSVPLEISDRWMRLRASRNTPCPEKITAGKRSLHRWSRTTRCSRKPCAVRLRSTSKM